LPSFMALPKAIGILEAPRKATVIRLRWLVVIICSCLLLSSQGGWGTTGLVHGFILFYILTNIALYFVAEKFFELFSFYAPLVIFDTFLVTASLVMSGQVGSDFYLAYFLIIILCLLLGDFRRLMLFAAAATLLYGYFLFATTEFYSLSLYLRIPFLFVSSLFYGYFAQVVHTEKALKEEAEQEARDISMIQTLSQSLPSSLDYQQVLETVEEKINNVIHAAQPFIFVVPEAEGPSRGLLFTREEGGGLVSKEVDTRQYPMVEECLRSQSPVIRRSAGADPSGIEGQDRSRGFSFPVSVAVPITFRGETHGVILLGFKQTERAVSSRELQSCQIVAFAAGMALSNAKKYEELQEEAKKRQAIAEELVEANRLRSEYLTNTSHELRTPIAAMIGYSHLLLDEGCGPLTPDQKKALGRLLVNARGLLGLVDALLDYSKLEKGEASLFTKQQEVWPLLDQLRRELAPLEERRPYRVKYEVEEGSPAVETDWGKLKSVLVNLLSNAIKFTDGGEVKLSVVNGGSEKEVSFVVSDTGVGIPENQIPLIFDKFRQVDGSPARHFEGAGLGLAISKNLVDLLGGRIEVESVVGQGSTFKVTIPITIS